MDPADTPGPLPARLALRRGFALSVRLASETTRIPGEDGPVELAVMPSEDASDITVPPMRLAPLRRLHAIVLRAFRARVSSAIATGRPFDREGVASELATIARRVLARDPALQMVVDAEGGPDLQLVPLVPLQDGAVHYHPRQAVAGADRALPVARGRPHLAIELRPEQLPELSELLGMLAGGVHGHTVRDRLGSAPFAREVLQGLIARQLVDGAPEVPRHAEALAEGEVAHLGHGTLLANLGGAHALFDPWWIPASRLDAVLPPAPRDLPRPEAVFLSHHTAVDLETLLELDTAVPVYVPAAADGAALAPPLQALLAELGFRDVRTVGPGDRIALGRGEVEVVRTEGLDPLGTGAGAVGWILRAGGGAALVAGAGRPVVPDGSGPLSPVFVCRRRVLRTAIELGWPALLQPASRWTAPVRGGGLDPEDIAALVGPDALAVLYVEGGAAWYPRGTDVVSTRGADPLEAAGDPRFVDLAEIRAACDAEIHLASPHDVFSFGGREVRRLDATTR